jgi:polyphosphate glucokinase
MRAARAKPPQRLPQWRQHVRRRTESSVAKGKGSLSAWPHNVMTLGIDVGGSGIKGAVLDAEGRMTTDRVRVATPYPCPPQRLLAEVQAVAAQLPRANRVSVGFPGLVRNGRVLQVPALSRATYGGDPDPSLAARWKGFWLAEEMAAMFGMPTKVVNDADMQGCAVVTGKGFEFVMTLGTGVGVALFNEGALLPHMELSHGPFRGGVSFDLTLGNAGRKDLGRRKWRRLVNEAIGWFDEMLFFDTIYIGGGNAKHLDPEDLPGKAVVVPNTAGITGGVRVWDLTDD